jgi:aminomethyltransferase
MLDRGIARQGHDVLIDGETRGIVTSGTQTPFLKKAIGMAYLPIDRATTGMEVEVDIRGRLARARVVAMPFYKRPAQV